jgi:hypothetical protein
LTFFVGAGFVLTVAAALMPLVRAPAAFHSFDSGARAAVGRNQLGGALATADSVGLNDDFVLAAFQAIPSHAHFAVVLPPDLAKAEAADGVNPITFAAAPSYFEDYLMPRREDATVTRGIYIVCLYCESPYWDTRTHWRSSAYGGGRVGYVYR